MWAVRVLGLYEYDGRHILLMQPVPREVAVAAKSRVGVRDECIKDKGVGDLVHPTRHEGEKREIITVLIRTPLNAALGEPVIDKWLVRQKQGGVINNACRTTHCHQAVRLGSSRERGKPMVAN